MDNYTISIACLGSLGQQPRVDIVRRATAGADDGTGPRSSSAVCAASCIADSMRDSASLALLEARVWRIIEGCLLTADAYGLRRARDIALSARAAPMLCAPCAARVLAIG